MISNTDYQSPEMPFYAVWLSLSVVSAFVAFVAYFLILKPINNIDGGWIVINGQRHIAEDYLAPYILWPIYALLYACLQYLVLRKHFPRLGWWILATAISLPFTLLGLKLGGLIASSLRIDFYSPWTTALELMLLGGILGAAQWFVLRRYSRQAIWWIPANVIGWGLAVFARTFGIMAILLLPGVLTAIILYSLLNRFSLAPEEK